MEYTGMDGMDGMDAYIDFFYNKILMKNIHPSSWFFFSFIILLMLKHKYQKNI